MMSSRFRYSIQGFYNVHYNFQHLVLYSTKSPNQTTNFPNQSYTNYLIHHLGFSPQQALSTSTKLRSKNPNYFKSSDNANSVVHFLKQHGFDDTHIIKMDHIIHDLRAILGSNDNLIKFFRKTHLFMGPSALGNLNSNIVLLNNEYVVDIQVIRNGILQQPGSYLRNTEFFRNVLVRVEEELRIPRNSGTFLSGVHLLCNSSTKRIESKCQLFKTFGWTEYDVSELMMRIPIAFLFSEENIRKKLGFLMTELGYKPDFLATHAALLALSLEKRMAPRHRVLLVLKEKGLLDYNFFTAAIKTERQFLKILIEPFKEDASGLLELYQSNKGCSNIGAISR